MNKKVLAVFGSAVIVAVLIILLMVSLSGTTVPVTVKQMKLVANSFPVPNGTQVAFPDNEVKQPATYTKGWIVDGPIDGACETWRELYRGWIGSQNIGQVTGDSTSGQSCDFSGPKNGYTATLQLAVYGSNPQPQVTLTITNR